MARPSMDRYAVIGNPVQHSLSPQIHQAFAAATGQTLRYQRLPAPEDAFEQVAGEFFAAGAAGANVTVPFKARAAAWVDHLSPEAAAAGAVNTIVVRPDGRHGHNTDGAGLVHDLTRRCGLELGGCRILLLGAGGAAHGAIRPLLAERPAALTVANRTAARARALVHELQSEGFTLPAQGIALEAVGGTFDLVINATASGLGAEVPALPEGAVAGAFCYDMMYAPPGAAATSFCRWSEQQGARAAVDGLGMLVEQAALAFALWRGIAPETEPVLQWLRAGAPARPD